jgi:EAL domain-containing protein (putative c-di-GMP-specific phosphodiesterase class I)
MTISADLAEAMGEAIDPMRLVQRVTDRTLELIAAADGAMVGLSDDLGITYVSGAGQEVSPQGTRVQLDTSLSGLALQTGRLQRCDDTEGDDRVDRETARRLSIVSLMCVPLTRAGETLGVLAVTARRPYAFSDTDVATLTQLADFISVVVGSARDLSRVKSGLMHLDDPDGDRPEAATPDSPASDAATRYVMSVLSPDAVDHVDSGRRIRRVLSDPSALTVVYQPIFDLVANEMTAVEALARFEATPYRPPNVWFEEAHRHGLGVDLEMVSITRVLAELPSLPSSVDLTVNVGPNTVMSSAFRDAVAPYINRIIVELTEHRIVDDYPKLVETLRSLRHEGARISVDDTGAGYSSLTHILKLAPDYIKLDRDLISSIDVDPVRRALAAALVSFADGTGAHIVAEGVEDGAELHVLRSLGVRYAQGYYLGRPSAAEDFLSDEEIAQASGAAAD